MYTLVKDKLPWLEAVGQCPIRVPGSQIARIRNRADYNTISRLLVEQFPNPTDLYQGAWIGLVSKDPAPTPVGQPAGNWMWVDSVTSAGELATPEQLYWGGPGTGFNGLPQPDNSGGSQRCTLIAVGAIPPTLTSPFYDGKAHHRNPTHDQKVATSTC